MSYYKLLNVQNKKWHQQSFPVMNPINYKMAKYSNE